MLWEILHAVSVPEGMGMKFHLRETEGYAGLGHDFSELDVLELH